MQKSSGLRIVDESRWLRGFTNLFQAANDSWWHTKRWLVQAGLWLVLLNGILALILWRIPSDTLPDMFASLGSITSMDDVVQNLLASSLIMYTILVGIGLPIAAIIAGQDAFIGERQSGTAAWVLSKPVTRPAFVLSRLAASTIGMLVTGVLLQGVVAYAQLSIRIGSWWPIAGFSGAMGLAFLNLLFYLTLTYMLGALLNNRGMVLGISLSTALIGPVLLRTLPVLKDITPWSFFLDQTDLPDGFALMLGQSSVSVTPIVLTALMCLVFVVITILRFQREEF
jgi:ABC-2 type transport system permease protein